MKHNFKKFLGQNFLIDQNIINKIVNYINLENEEVIEIGPGQGALTFLLCEKAKKVRAYEIDEELINYLKSKILAKNFELFHEDFLKSKLEFNTKQIIIANIPYYITSDILFKIFDNKNQFKKIIMMVQEEIADKLMAKKNSSNYGKLSVSAQFFGNIKKIIKVPKTCFFPKPKVDSTVIFIELYDENYSKDFCDKFLNFIKICFKMQRKTLINNLKTIYNLSLIIDVLKQNNLSIMIRPQQIDLKMYKILFNSLN